MVAYVGYSILPGLVATHVSIRLVRCMAEKKNHFTNDTKNITVKSLWNKGKLFWAGFDID